MRLELALITDLVVGTMVIAATVVTHTFGLMAVTRLVASRLVRLPGSDKGSETLAMISVVIGLFAVLTVEIWIWALVYAALDVVGNFATALYFSTTTFATVGFGDVVPVARWRLLAALEGVNGFLLIGWSTAYLVSAGTRIGPFRVGEHF